MSQAASRHAAHGASQRTSPARLLARRFFGTAEPNGWQRAYLSCLLHRYPGWIGPLPQAGKQPTPRTFHAALLACGADLPRAPAS